MVLGSLGSFQHHSAAKFPPWACRQAHLQHAGEVHGNVLQQSPVGPPPFSLPGCYVEVALTDQSPHLFHGSARVNVITQGFMNCCLLVIEAE